MPFTFCLAFECSKSTGPSTATVTGKVTLEAQTNHSGVKVTLYELTELDTTTLRLNKEYPNIGVTISQQTEFDHRLGTVVAQTQSRSDGSFRIEGVPSGEYNLVAQKDGFGWKYICNVKVGNDSNLDMTGTLPDREIKLLREVEVNKDITANTVWESDRHYIIKGDVNVYSGVTLTIEPGAWVRFDGPYKLNVEGSLQAAGEDDRKIIFTSNSESPKVGDWKSISFTGTDNTSSSTVENSVIRFGTTGVSCQGRSAKVSKSIFSDLAIGVYCSDSSVQKCPGRGFPAIWFGCS